MWGARFSTKQHDIRVSHNGKVKELPNQFTIRDTPYLQSPLRGIQGYSGWELLVFVHWSEGGIAISHTELFQDWFYISWLGERQCRWHSHVQITMLSIDVVRPWLWGLKWAVRSDLTCWMAAIKFNARRRSSTWISIMMQTSLCWYMWQNWRK